MNDVGCISCLLKYVFTNGYKRESSITDSIVTHFALLKKEELDNFTAYSFDFKGE
jgi:hypothetical protein